MKEFDAMLYEFQTDYNQTHFVRNETFKKAANDIQGPARKIFIEFLERSCTAEFSGFLLYKELGRRLKKTNPVGEHFLFSNRSHSLCSSKTAMECLTRYADIIVIFLNIKELNVLRVISVDILAPENLYPGLHLAVKNATFLCVMLWADCHSSRQHRLIQLFTQAKLLAGYATDLYLVLQLQRSSHSCRGMRPGMLASSTRPCQTST